MYPDQESDPMPNKKVKLRVVKVKLFRDEMHFSVTQLIIFALIFSLAGGYFLWRSFAASPVVATVQAENMSLPAGATVISDTSANGGKAVKLTQNGTASTLLSLPSTANSVTVVAKGSKCQGTWPKVSIKVDNNAILSGATVSSNSWRSYSASTNLNSGTHNLSLNYSSGSRNCANLYLDVVLFYGPAPPPTPVPTVSLSASPISVTAGGSSTLTWASTNATSCTASGGWSGTKATSGNYPTGALNTTITYNLDCTGAGGTTRAATTVTVTPVTIIYQPPIVISSGGTYSGNWEGTGSGPAVKIATSQPVIIQNSMIKNSGGSHLIDANYPGVNLTVLRSTLEGATGGTGMAVYGYGFKSIRIENCTINHTWGIRLDNIQSGGTIVVTKNKGSNISRDVSNLSHFFQAATNHQPATIEVSWNEVIGAFQRTGVEDIINIYDAGFAKIHDNYLQGAYPQNAGDGFSGSGIMLDSSAHDNEVYNNQVVDTTNAGIGIASGWNNKVHDNRMVFDGKLDDGTVLAASNIGLFVWNYDNNPYWANNDAWNNVVGWIRYDGQRNDSWLPNCSGNCSNSGLPNPITHSTELAEYQSWLNKLAANGVVIGN